MSESNYLRSPSRREILKYGAGCGAALAWPSSQFLCANQNSPAAGVAAGNTQVLPKELGQYTISRSGVYQIVGTVTGNIAVDLRPGDYAKIVGIGNNAVLKGTLFPVDTLQRDGDVLRLKAVEGEPKIRHKSHISGSIPEGAKLVLENFTLEGYAHNAIGFTGDGSKMINGVNIINYTRIIGGSRLPVYGAGGINAGANSRIVGGRIQPGDDAIKLTAPNSHAKNVHVTMYGNGTAIQLGWEDRSVGADHTADSIRIDGQITQYAPQESGPGRSVIGGNFSNKLNPGQPKTVSNIRLTNLDIRITKYTRLIYLVSSENTRVENIVIQGKLPNGIFNPPGGARAIRIEANNSSVIDQVKIDLGPEAAKPRYQNIIGKVRNLKFVG